MAGFHDVRFPADISYGAMGGPHYLTDVSQLSSGAEKRIIRWGQPLARYNVAHGVKTGTQRDTLISFFRARQGRGYGFRYKDWSDYQAVNQSLGTGDTSTTSFQLVKIYSSGSESVSRNLTRPVQGTVALYVDSVLQSGNYTVDYDTGEVTFDTAPAGGTAISADAEFDVPVRFDTDALAISLDQYNSYSWQDIPLVELRE